MRSSARPSWRGRLRAYGAAVALNVALISSLPAPKPVEPVPIVRPLQRRLDGFDPRELVGDGLVLTVPLIEFGTAARSVPSRRNG